MTPFRVELTFHDDLPFFLRSKKPAVARQLKERTSVKDVIEACGVPHTEVDLILIERSAVGFDFVISRECKIDIYGVAQNRDPLFPENRLQVPGTRSFVADGHLGKLVRDLRLLGIDVAYDRGAEDRQLVATATSQDRALLTRDRRLLMHSAVEDGYYLRSQDSLEQTQEVVRRFRLGPHLNPFTRCLRCNALLHAVGKEQVVEKLEPLTKIYYEQFRNCSGCGQIYWSGSHFAKLQERIAKITGGL
jgi:uncharacterized protein with PIN domain